MTETRPDTREHLISVAAQLLATSVEEPSTRAICAAAGVGAPTLYHHFGDKQGLFDAVVAKGFEDYLARKRDRVDTGDPVEDLRHGWDTHVEFGVTNPAFYTLMYGIGRGGRRPPAAAEAYRILVGMVEQVAMAGRLLAPVSQAADMIEAAGIGVTMALIANGERPGLSERTRDAVLAAITTGPRVRPAGVAPLALALEAALATEAGPLSSAEQILLREWLNKLAN